MWPARYLSILALTCAATLSSPAVGEAQADTTTQPSRLLETRASLEGELRAADSLRHTALAAQIRARLANGDFSQGDKLIVTIVDAPAPLSRLPDTLVVSAEGMVSFLRNTQIADLSLKGVLRSEAADRVTQHIARTLIRPTVRVTLLIRIGVLGSVSRQGYYVVSPESQLSDLITLAGGYTSESDPGKMELRRGAATVMKGGDVRDAMREGESLDRLHLLAGDELFVGRRAARSWLTIVQVSLGIATSILFLIAARRH